MSVTLITPEILTKIAPSIKGDKAAKIADSLNRICPSDKYQINTKDRFEEFLSQLLHESGEFSISTENMNYTTPQRLIDMWPKHFPNLDFAAQYIRNPEKLGNYIYGSTSIAKDLGNIKPEDGYNLRGGGPIQLTGRYSYTKFGQFMGESDLYKVANLVRTDLDWGIHSACWEYCVDKKLIVLSEADEELKITKSINGGTNGFADRQTYYKRCIDWLIPVAGENYVKPTDLV